MVSPVTAQNREMKGIREDFRFESAISRSVEHRVSISICFSGEDRFDHKVGHNPMNEWERRPELQIGENKRHHRRRLPAFPPPVAGPERYRRRRGHQFLLQTRMIKEEEGDWFFARSIPGWVWIGSTLPTVGSPAAQSKQVMSASSRTVEEGMARSTVENCFGDILIIQCPI